ncbi:hypothetical protein SCLCIDRAFT_390187 [Scleroderma citrinum Foug A]|uniref:Uncharacterized protein n=1 Tax=Scleroderma citrinum Foug A TaxID=1036808 RepID=A0A0C3DCW8_9AGAM|nr:hypothetical protein SCLCIDRAFT_390187 [Scleroderma citrinum Foug A]
MAGQVLVPVLADARSRILKKTLPKFHCSRSNRLFTLAQLLWRYSYVYVPNDFFSLDSRRLLCHRQFHACLLHETYSFYFPQNTLKSPRSQQLAAHHKKPVKRLAILYEAACICPVSSARKRVQKVHTLAR